MDPKNILPHREPFLFIDKVIDHTEDSLIAEITFDERHDFLKGHFPGNPIVPGVILCEALFQTGALLMRKNSQDLPVVTRIQNAKFKKMAKPHQKLTLQIKLNEQIANAYYLTGKVTSEEGTIATVDFACALVSES